MVQLDGLRNAATQRNCRRLYVVTIVCETAWKKRDGSVVAACETPALNNAAGCGKLPMSIKVCSRPPTTSLLRCFDESRRFELPGTDHAALGRKVRLLGRRRTRLERCVPLAIA